MYCGRITCIIALGLALAGAATVRGQEAEPSGTRPAPVEAPAPKAAPKAPPAVPGNPAPAAPAAKPAAPATEPAAPTAPAAAEARPAPAATGAKAEEPAPRHARPRRRTARPVTRPAAEPAAKPAPTPPAPAAKPAAPVPTVKPAPAVTAEKPFLTDYEDPKAKKEDLPLGRVILDLAWKLVVVLAVAYGVLYALRGLMVRQGGLPGRKGALRVLESVALAPNRSIHLVRVAGKVIVVGSTPEQITALTEIDDPEDLARISAESAPSFAARLDGALTDNGHESGAPQAANQTPGDVASGVRDGVRHLWDQVQQIRGLRPPKGGPR